MNRDAFRSFLFTTGELFGSGDLDPLYPYLRNLLPRLGASMDEKLWFVQLYHAYYRVDSAWRHWSQLPHRDLSVPLPTLPVATERRNLRVKSRMSEHLVRLLGTDLSWWEEFGARVWKPVPWQDIYDVALALKHNGPWAAFKWTDLARYVLGWDLTPTPPSVASGAGPAKGLALLGATLAELGAALSEASIEMPWDQLETCLCKWHGVTTGHYTVHQDLEELKEQTAPYPKLAAVYEATNFALRLPVTT